MRSSRVMATTDRHVLLLITATLFALTTALPTAHHSPSHANESFQPITLPTKFISYDLNKDDYIDLEELANVSDTSLSEASKPFRSADTNEDGLVNRAEFEDAPWDLTGGFLRLRDDNEIEEDDEADDDGDGDDDNEDGYDDVSDEDGTKRKRKRKAKRASSNESDESDDDDDDSDGDDEDDNDDDDETISNDDDLDDDDDDDNMGIDDVGTTDYDNKDNGDI